MSGLLIDLIPIKLFLKIGYMLPHLIILLKHLTGALLIVFYFVLKIKYFLAYVFLLYQQGILLYYRLTLLLDFFYFRMSDLYDLFLMDFHSCLEEFIQIGNTSIECSKIVQYSFTELCLQMIRRDWGRLIAFVE